jgi:hypothetical protein
MSLRNRLLLFVAVPLTVIGILTTAALLWWRWDTAHQTKLSNELPAMDQAITTTVTAAGNQTPVAISGIVEGSPCTLGPLRHGGHFTRSVDLYTDPGGETTLIDRIAAALPATYQPRRGTPIGNNAAPLTATPAPGVQLSVNQISPGWVVARARTDCSSGTPSNDTTTLTPAAGPVTNLLTALHTQAAQTRQNPLGCPGGITTLAAVSEPANAADLARRLANQIPATSHQITTQSNRVAYRQDDTSVIVAASDDNTAITIQYTSTC